MIPQKLLVEKDTFSFWLSDKFTIEKAEATFSKEKYVKLNSENGISEYAYIGKNKVKGDHTLHLKYSGKVDEDIQENAITQARGFSTTSGIISEKGIYMAGATVWVPVVGDELYSYNLQVKIDAEWSVVSQGKRTVNSVEKNVRTVKYESPELMDEVHLISAKFTEYEMNSNDVLVQAFLRTADEELATRYLTTTSQYLELYERVIGKYPYTKFALVENFWETGYGMPSFTLLGEKVIRFPFILHSSYPHELLHNWWGNSVYVDYDQGNWCEGLTAYMADHLIKEQQGMGSKYRREALEKFTNYVNAENDFPVSEFLSRNDPAQEAIGYGKVMMINEMLRNKVGDAAFMEAYSKFYEENKFTYAGWDDIQRAFEAVSKTDLSAFFKQWTSRKGAPTIKLTNVSVTEKDGYELSFTIEQTQAEDVFNLDIPVLIYLEGQSTVVEETINCNARTTRKSFSFDSRPLKVDVDPMSNIFRRLDPNEIPPILSQLFGATNANIVLPKNAKLFDAYKKQAEDWKAVQEAQHKNLTIYIDEEISELPNGPTWIFGTENKFAKDFIQLYYQDYLSAETISTVETSTKEGSMVYTFMNPENGTVTGMFSSTIEAAIPALGRKLPHYGKYSYLGFEGEGATNVLKGEFPALNSPLSYTFEWKDKPQIFAKPVPRQALGSN